MAVKLHWLLLLCTALAVPVTAEPDTAAAPVATKLSVSVDGGGDQVLQGRSGSFSKKHSTGKQKKLLQAGRQELRPPPKQPMHSDTGSTARARAGNTKPSNGAKVDDVHSFMQTVSHRLETASTWWIFGGFLGLSLLCGWRMIVNFGEWN